MAIKELKNSIVLENKYAEITISKKDTAVEKVIDKKTKKDIKAEDTLFFSFINRAEEPIATTGLALSGDLLIVSTEKGDVKVKALAFDNYFTFEVAEHMPEGIFQMTMAHAKYSYDYLDKKNTGACGIAMTIWANPVYYPDSKSLETMARVYPHLGDVEAKYGLLIAPIIEQKEILRSMFLTIDKNKGIVSTTGGVWGREFRPNHGNYIIQYETSPAYVEKNLPFFKEIGVDQVDLHHSQGTFRQGDFKFMRYKDAQEFKEKVTDVFEANGISLGLHTYSYYISYGASPILSVPEKLRQIKTMHEFTLAEDLGDDDTFIKVLEDYECISMDRGFCRTNSPFFAIDDEMIYFNKTLKGLEIVQRGCSGTKAVAHKKGAKVRHLEGHYGGLTPVFGSDLFYEIAANTAKAYNEAGFKMIYLDALDGVRMHCDKKHEYWFYKTAFTHAVLKDCIIDPLLEAADGGAPMYAAKGREGAWDYAYRSYKGYTDLHVKDNSKNDDKYISSILGWYSFYPMTDNYPGNEHTKYHHTDAIDYLGSKAIMHDYANVFSGNRDSHARYAGLRRNTALYKKYDDLRKREYFSEEYRKKLIEGKYEYQLKEKRGGKFCFVEKDYQFAKLYDLSDDARNFGSFNNPFGAQVPFIRIEAMHSTLKNNPIVLLRLDENVDLLSQKTEAKYNLELDLSQNLAKVVKVKGNGIKGGKICIKISCGTNSETGFGEYIIDTDFQGWREFVLLESDNGERKDHNFEAGYHMYAVYRSSLNNNRTSGVKVETEGDMTGVKMSSIVAYEHTYEIYKNPTVTIGDTSIMFEFELLSGDFIEFDGKNAKAIDRYGNEMPIWFKSENFKAPRGKFKATLNAKPLNRGVPRAKLTFGFTGKEIK